MTFKEHKFKKTLKTLKFVHWQLRLKQEDIRDNTPTIHKNENKLKGSVKNKLINYFMYGRHAKVYDKNSESEVKESIEPIRCTFFYNLKKIRTLPFFFNRKKLYVIYQLPFLKQVLRQVIKVIIYFFLNM